MFLAVRLTVRH